MSKTLTEETITRKLHRTYQPGIIASTDGYAGMYEKVELTCAAVLVPLVCREDGWHLLFTRRTDSVYHHKGQVSFPGGACDEGESTPEETALREANEEIGLRPDHVRVLGRLNATLTITHYRVTPVVGVMPWPYSLRPAPREVGRVFTIPLQWLSQEQNWDVRNATPKGVQRAFPVIIYHPYDGEILWGATARMTHDFLKVIGMLKNK